jgi:hypothetical protein
MASARRSAKPGPRCFGCNKPMTFRRWIEGGGMFNGYEHINGIKRAPAFCTLRCATAAAAVFIAAGRRLKLSDGTLCDGGERDGTLDTDEHRLDELGLRIQRSTDGMSFSPVRDAAERDLPACPKCGAHRGDPCRTPAGVTTPPHVARDT